MQKKIVAGICAAALALAMPVAAFAETAVFDTEGVAPSNVTASIEKVKNGNVTLKNIVLSGVKGYVATADITAAGTGAAPSNAIANSVASFKIDAYGADRAALASLGTKYNKLTADVQFAEAVTAVLPTSVDTNNLYVGGKFVSNIGGQVANVDPYKISGVDGANTIDTEAKIAATSGGKVTVNGLGTGTLTVWMQNGKYGAGDANTADMAKEAAADASKSPKTGELL